MTANILLYKANVKSTLVCANVFGENVLLLLIMVYRRLVVTRFKVSYLQQLEDYSILVSFHGNR